MAISWRDDTLPNLARRYNIDLDALADDAVRERLLRDPISAFTSRMLSVVLAAHQEARRLGHSHTGTEHVFQAILTDGASLPSQVLKDMGVLDDVLQRVGTMLTSEAYLHPKTGDDASP